MTKTDFAASSTDHASIPVIDISGAMATGNHNADLNKVAQEIHDAATTHGFFYISGHGIHQPLIDQAFAVAKDFFALPEVDKATVAVDTNQRGWMAQGMSRLSGSKTHDLKEVFFWGTEIAPDDPDLRAGKPLVATNQWPDEVFPRLKTDLTPYYSAVCRVARRVMAAIAVSLGRPPDFFDACYKTPLARGQLVYYPPSTPADEAAERFGVAPHTDFGVLTLLLQDQSGGLQVQSTTGNWIEAPPLRGTLVCNIGDLLERWSNNRFTSTLHRVVNRSGAARYAIPVFFDPHTDTVIDPTDLGIPEADRLYAPVVAGQHIANRNRKSFSHYKD